jgi:hypothetical protein
MARRTTSRETRLKKGRGTGHGKEYSPYLTVRDVPSLGLVSRIKGWKTDRVHHLLSNHEKRYFYVLEWAAQVIDIREQFPLPLEVTLEIAGRLGIKHPTNPMTQEPADMTTDFLVDELADGIAILKARAVKPAADLNNSRTIEKLEIERTYWHEQGVDWGIVTEKDIPEDLAKNVEWIHDALDPDVSPAIPEEILPMIERQLYKSMTSNSGLALSFAGLRVDSELGLEPGTGLWAVRHLIASRQWSVEMMAPLSPSKPMIPIRTLRSEANKEAM